MSDVLMMFVSHTRLIEYFTFVNKKRDEGCKKSRERKIAQSDEKKRGEIDDRQLLRFLSTV